ncbi:MAG: GHKL domain-containing protein [Lachnospiraceae bacterium]|nr:GHKL domain-containing protein [Lachnospiraceae bacterium]
MKGIFFNMTFLIIILEMLPSFFEAILFIYIISNCLELKEWYRQHKAILLFVTTVLNITLSSLITNVTLRLLSLYLVNLITTIFFTKKEHISSKILYGSSFVCFTVFSEKLTIFTTEFLIGYPMDSIDQITIIRYWLIFVYEIVLAFMCYLFVHRKKHSILFPKPFLLFFSIGIAFCIISSELLLKAIVNLEQLASYNTSSLQVVSVAYMCIQIMLFSLVIYMGRLYEKNLILSEQKRLSEMEQQQLITLKTANISLRSWKHDIQNHLRTMAQLLHNDNPENCKKYIQKLLNNLQYANHVIYTYNPIIDAVLSLKFLEIETKQISLSHAIFISDIKKFPMDDVKLTSILSNLLDNGIEACEKVETTPFIDFTMKNYHSQFLIHIKNSSNGIYQYDTKQHLKSTKTAPNHGNGISRICTLVEEAGGFYKIRPEANYFSITILLPMKIQDTF